MNKGIFRDHSHIAPSEGGRRGGGGGGSGKCLCLIMGGGGGCGAGGDAIKVTKEKSYFVQFR